MADFENGREFTRVPLKLEAIVNGPTGRVFSGPARDIAMSGLYVQGRCEIPEGSPCSIEIRLGENDGPRTPAPPGRGSQTSGCCLLPTGRISQPSHARRRACPGDISPSSRCAIFDAWE